MPSSRTYGVVCPACKKSFSVGRIDLPPYAGLLDLENELSEQDWKPGFRVCPNPKCKAAIYVTLQRLTFVDGPDLPQM